METERGESTRRTVVRPIRLDPDFDDLVTTLAKKEERPVATMLYLLAKDGYRARTAK